MRRGCVARLVVGVGLALLLCGIPRARAQAVAEAGAVNQPAPAPTAEPPVVPESEPEPLASRWSLGARAFGGGIFSSEEQRGGGGCGMLLAFGIVPERWELELGLSLVKAREIEPMGVVEVVGKRIFEPAGQWAPHVLLGPVLSLDFGEEFKAAGGLILGGGVTYWFKPWFGVVVDAAWRLLIGAEVEQVLTLALGPTFRL